MRFVLTLFAALALASCGGESAEPPASPSPSPPPPAASATGRGLTVSQALAVDVGGPLLVRGALYVRDGETRLCEALAESYPPQCGGASLLVEGVDVSEVEGVQTAEGISWTEGEIKLLGVIEKGTLVVSDTAQA